MTEAEHKAIFDKATACTPNCAEDECGCPCHRTPGMLHFAACCAERCPHCGKNINFGFEDRHFDNCPQPIIYLIKRSCDVTTVTAYSMRLVATDDAELLFLHDASVVASASSPGLSLVRLLSAPSVTTVAGNPDVFEHRAYGEPVTTLAALLANGWERLDAERYNDMRRRA